MDRDALGRLEHENLIEAIAAAASQAPGARIERDGGVALIATGLPLRLFNQVVIERDAQADAIAAAVSVVRERGDLFIVNLRAGTDDAFVPLMGELGLVPLSAEPWMPGMVLHPLPPAGGALAADGHEIRTVSDAPGITDHIRTAAAGFEMPVEWLEAVMTPELGARPEAAVYVGYSAGVPVTTGFGFRTGRTIGVYNISTVKLARRRGLGAAMTMRIVDDGLAAGCNVAVLQATQMGLSVYERLGFRTVVEYIGYADPASMTEGAPRTG